MAVNVARRIALLGLACLAAGTATALSPPVARASAPSRIDPDAPLDAEPFLRFAASSARMQARAAALALLKQPRPELENLEPLDFLALSRRGVEVQTQALQQELRFYRAYLALVRDGVGGR